MEQHAIPSDPSVRERLLRAAVRLFARKGYAATKVREIVDAAGVTKLVLYYYFGSKDGLFQVLMGELLANFNARVDACLQVNGTARDRIGHLCGELFDIFIAHQDIARFMHAVYTGPDQSAPPFNYDQFHQKIEAAVRALIEEGIDAGEFRSGDSTAMGLAVMGVNSMGIAIRSCHRERQFDRADLQRVLDLVFEGLLAQKP